MLILQQLGEMHDEMSLEFTLREPSGWRIGGPGKILAGLIVCVTAAAFRCVSRHHWPSLWIGQETAQHCLLRIIGAPFPRRCFLIHLGLHRVPQALVHDRFVLAFVDLALVYDLATVDRLLEKVEQAPTAEGDTSLVWPAGPILDLGHNAFTARC